ncbi:hypothetical protein D9M73_204220 [compost metagenome]
MPGHLHPLQGARTQEPIEKQPLAELAEGILLHQQFLPDRNQNLLEHHDQRVTGKNLAIDLFEATLIETPHRPADLNLPFAPLALDELGGNGMFALLERLGARQDLADLADRDTALDPAENAAHFIDIGLGIEAVAAVRARGLNQAITALPGAQGHRIDARDARDFPDRKQLLLIEAVFIQRRRGGFSHRKKNRW